MKPKVTAMVIVGVVTAALSLLLAFPVLAGLSSTPPFLYAAAFANAVGAFMALTGAVGILATVATGWGRRRGRGRPGARARPSPPVFARVRVLPLVALASVVVFAFGSARFVVAADRGWSGNDSPRAIAASRLVVIQANTLETAAPPSAIVDQASRYGADVISLQEVDEDYVRDVARGMGNAGAPMRISFDPGEPGVAIQGTALLVPSGWDGFAPAPRGPGLVVQRSPWGTFGAVHTDAPVQANLRDGSWDESVTEAAGQCRSMGGGIFAGDYNSTLDHAPLNRRGDCRDAASELGLGSRGTWRADIPAPVAAAIDHQLYDPARWTPTAGAILDLPGSDHRGIVVGYEDARN